MVISGFDWDDHNRGKCQKHGVSKDEIEALFFTGLMVQPDIAHSDREERFLAIGKSLAGRWIFLAFTIRGTADEILVRPISARYMHRREIEHYEKENPGTLDG